MRLTRRGLRAGLLACLAVPLTVLALAGCGAQDSGGPPDRPPPSDGGGDGGGGGGGGTPTSLRVTVTAAPVSITAGDAGTELVATVRRADTNALVSNATVTFSVDSATIASLSRTSAPTDATGTTEATPVTLTGNRAGSSIVTARVSGTAGTGSGTVTVNVLAPIVTIEASASEIAASAPTGVPSVITATVTDRGGAPLAGKTVTFAKSFGDLDFTTRVTDADGQASVKLTSKQAGDSTVSATVLGATSPSATVKILPGPVTAVTLTPSPDQIVPVTGSSTLTVTAADEFGNPVAGTVAFDPAANVAPDAAALVGGEAAADFTSALEGTFDITATVTDSDGNTVAKTVAVRVERRLVGEPAIIQFQVSNPEITVQGGGGQESSSITVRVLDVNSDAIADSASNVQFKILRGPPGVRLDGIAGVGQILTRSTNGGSVTVNLQSGPRPGTVDVLVSVIRDSAGNLLAPPLTATVPRITVRSGAPSALLLSEANDLQSPGLQGAGTITHDYVAEVTDLWGNAVPDGTIVFFGQFLDFLQECRNRWIFDPYNPAANDEALVQETCAGPEAGVVVPSADPLDDRATFTSTKAEFLTRGVKEGDTLVLLAPVGANPEGYGGYVISEVVDETTVRLQGNPPAGNGLEWAVGNNLRRGGGVFTTEEQAATVGGIARWSNTYVGELIGSPVYIHAETEGGTQGHARAFALPGRAPAAWQQTVGPEAADKLRASTWYGFRFRLVDGSTPTPYEYASQAVDVAVGGGELDFPVTLSFRIGQEVGYVEQRGWLDPGLQYLALETTAPVGTQYYPGGEVAFYWLTPPVAVETEVVLSVGGQGTVSKIKFKVAP